MSGSERPGASSALCRMPEQAGTSNSQASHLKVRQRLRVTRSLQSPCLPVGGPVHHATYLDVQNHHLQRAWLTDMPGVSKGPATNELCALAKRGAAASAPASGLHQ